MNIIFLVIVGAVAGYLATRIMRVEAGLLPTIGIGIAGALIGGLVLQLALAVLGILAGLIGAVLGALLPIFIYRSYWVGRR